MILAAFAPALEPRANPPILLSWREGRLCVPVRVGEQSLWFLLDTGCQRSFLTRKGRVRLLLAGARPEADGTVRLDGARLGDFPIDPVPLASEDPTLPAEDPVDGFLGADVLRRYQVGLDFRELTLRLWPTGAAADDWFTAPPDARLRVAFEERIEGWCVPVEVNNLTVPMVLDTGASSTFVHTDVAAGLRGARKAKDLLAPFYDGLHKSRAYTVPAVGIGGTSFGERTIYAASVPRMVGLLGRDLLAPLKILLDYQGGTATFAGANGEPLPTFAGPRVTLPNGVVVHWPGGTVGNAPPGCAYVLPPGYREVFNRDESVSLIPPRGS